MKIQAIMGQQNYLWALEEVAKDLLDVFKVHGLKGWVWTFIQKVGQVYFVKGNIGSLKLLTASPSFSCIRVDWKGHDPWYGSPMFVVSIL